MAELLKRPETMIDVYRLLPEGTPIQVINNEFYMSPAPNFSHFNTVDAIVDALKKVVANKKSGRVIFAPVDVFLGDKNALPPDIFYISNENAHLIKEDGIYGAPDIIIEVLSPGNHNADLVKKKSVYEEFGVKEYYVVNPDNKVVTSYFLTDKQFLAQPQQERKLISSVLDTEINF